MFDLSKNIKSRARIETRKIPVDKITPIRILEETGAPVLLESAYVKTGKSRYSLMILKEAFTLFKTGTDYYLKNPDGKQYIIKGTKNGFLSLLKEFRNRAPVDKTLYEFPLPLGGIGYLGYEFFNEIEDIRFKHEKDDRDIYDSAFIFGRTFLIFDHLHDEALLASAFYAGEIDDVDLTKELDSTEQLLNSLKGQSDNSLPDHPHNATILTSPHEKDEFCKKVETIKDEIVKGNLLQCVISRRITVKTDLSPLDAYRHLRMKNPSPYMLFFNFSDFVLFGASPEVMVRIKNNKVIVRPIAGTRPRGKSEEEDKKLEEDLCKDQKELAEHLMLVDLGRNDVGKVAVGGSVEVTEEMIVERYSKVMHIVSEVEGDLAPESTAEDAIIATFPAGTVSGAPKIQAIKTIDLLEDHRRGPYAGLAGYFERNGDFDSCIIIRSAIHKDNMMYLQAGAGIVYDSIPETEYQETENKAAALLAAIGVLPKTEETK